MNINQANKYVYALIGKDDYHDIEDMLISYYNLAQTEIASTVCPILKSFSITAGTETQLPENFCRFKSIPCGFTRIDSNHIIADGDGLITIKYYAYPEPIEDGASDDTEFEIDRDAQAAIPYFAAAQAVIADSDMRRYYAFMDMYNDILTNVLSARQNGSTVTVVSMEDM